MIRITKTSDWKGVMRVLNGFESELRKDFKEKESVIVWHLPSSSIAMRRMAIVKRRGRAIGYLLEITVGFRETQVETKELKPYNLNHKFIEQTRGVVQQTITKLLSNHNSSA